MFCSRHHQCSAGPRSFVGGALFGLILVSLVGCFGSKIDDDDDDGGGFDTGSSGSGYKTHDYFPLDGARSWTYYADSEPTLLQVNLNSETVELSGSTRIFTIEYRNFDSGELLYSIDWSSDATDGILIHGFLDERTGLNGTFDPPVVLAKPRMSPGARARMDYGDFYVISAFEGVEDCPNLWGGADWECLVFDVSTDWSESPPFIGKWWLATSWGPSWMQWEGMSEPWILAEAGWSPGD